MSQQEFDRSRETWPYKSIEPKPGATAGDVPLDACFLSVKPYAVVQTAHDFSLAEATLGSKVTEPGHPFSNPMIQPPLREELAKLLRVRSSEITLKGNTCDGIIDIALGYPFDKGDKVVVYRGDYPSVFVPFLARKDIEVTFLDGIKDPETRVDLGWTFDELVKAVDGRTKMLVISHVQYKSGQTADLTELGNFCAERGIKLVVDVAQSVGAVPVYPAEHKIDAVVFPFWKGLLSPRGGGALYMSPEFRDSLDLVKRTPSAQKMKFFGDVDSPFHTDGLKFEASTNPTQLFAETLASIRIGVGRYGIEAIGAEVRDLQQLFAAKIDSRFATAVTALDTPTGLIISFKLPHHIGKEEEVVKAAYRYGVRVTQREGLLRVAPHFYNSPEEIEHAAHVLNGILSGRLA